MVPLGLLLVLTVVPRCRAIHIHVDGGYEEMMGNELRELEIIIEQLSQAPKGCSNCARTDPALNARFNKLSQQYLLDDSSSKPQYWSREDVAARWNMPLKDVDYMAEQVGLCRKQKCDTPDSSHIPKPAWTLDQLKVPWKDISVPVEMIAGRRMKEAGFALTTPGDRLNDLPLSLANLPKFMARHFALQEWKAILQVIEEDPEGLTDADRIFLLAGLGRRDMQILGKAIVFPDLLTPEERRQAQGYPDPQKAARNIRHLLKYSDDDAVSIEKITRRVAYDPATITYNDCLLIRKSFHLDLEDRPEPKKVPPEQRRGFQNALLNTMEYIDVEHAVNWYPSSTRIETLVHSRQASQTREEFLARKNCDSFGYRTSMSRDWWDDNKIRNPVKADHGRLLGEMEEL